MGFAGVYPGPQLRQSALPSSFEYEAQQITSPSCPYPAIIFLSRLSISGRAIVEATGGQSFEAVTTVRHSSKSHTHHPWVAKTLQLPCKLPAQQHKDSSKK
ncbi:hypothetical protein, partial [Arthrobacter sp. Bz4]|uniref:hypothetical protein n=1 Tax=Arthrobacter sp. Bz4 TaxID=2171979 RepID=UPI001A9C5577